MQAKAATLINPGCTEYVQLPVKEHNFFLSHWHNFSLSKKRDFNHG
jgi:hypothetical protein